jgi:hypothetical protein
MTIYDGFAELWRAEYEAYRKQDLDGVYNDATLFRRLDESHTDGDGLDDDEEAVVMKPFTDPELFAIVYAEE